LEEIDKNPQQMPEIPVNLSTLKAQSAAIRRPHQPIEPLLLKEQLLREPIKEIPLDLIRSPLCPLETSLLLAV